tara:strand:+ start:99 stop:1862 length:1764 start_codon:yes stop_codon:yes gene_type:complete
VGRKNDLEEVEIGPETVPFVVDYDSSSLPATMQITGRGPLAMPFDNDNPQWQCKLNHTLPPSLDEADSGVRSQSESGLLAVSWQSLIHDTKLTELGEQPEIIAIVDALQLANHSEKLITAISAIRARFPSSLIWCPAIGGPDNLALLTWFGVDLFDFTRSRQAESMGYLLTSDGPRQPYHGHHESSIFENQVSQWNQELSTVKTAIENGSLRSLVDKRALNSPRLVEHLRYHDRLIRASLSDEMAAKEQLAKESASVCKLLNGAPLRRFVKDGTILRCNSEISRNDPLIADWIQRIETKYRTPEEQSKVLILLPCSARKPYSMSQSHRRFRRNLRHRPLHEVIVTAPLGLVPRELEELWPAGHYDIPVTGDWAIEEVENIRNLVKAIVANNEYELVINHSGVDFDASQIGVELIDTRNGDSAGSQSSLERLNNASEDAAKRFHSGYRMSEKQHLLIKMKAISRWLHNNDDWLSKAHVGGKPPRWKILDGKEQLAMWHPQDGRFAFAKGVLNLLAESKTLTEVHLIDGPKLEGDIFSPMIEKVVGDVRIGDEILLFRSGKLIGSARSIASKWEYFGSPGMVAKTKHRL